MADPSPTCPASPGSLSDDNRDSSKGALLITPMALSLLPDLQCPICHELYVEPPSAQQATEPDQECAVRVDMIAEWFGPKRCCGHILGRSCLVTHLQGPGAWRNKCPICRDVWYHDDAPADALQEERRPRAVPRGEGAPRRSLRIAARRTTAQGLAEQSLSRRYGVVVRSQRHPARFTQRLLAALQVEDGSEEVKGTMAEVERKLNTLYSDIAIHHR
ncbi:hypothetical protein ACEQ8H_007627 [Pleosporales sp. CAS-2024a]